MTRAPPGRAVEPSSGLDLDQRTEGDGKSMLAGVQTSLATAMVRRTKKRENRVKSPTAEKQGFACWAGVVSSETVEGAHKESNADCNARILEPCLVSQPEK